MDDGIQEMAGEEDSDTEPMDKREAEKRARIAERMKMLE